MSDIAKLDLSSIASGDITFTSYGYIKKETFDKKDYYDFYNPDGEEIYSDGETCEVIAEEGHAVILRSETSRVFALSYEESVKVMGDAITCGKEAA